MTSKQRLLAALRGDPVDRVPLMLPMSTSAPPAPADSFLHGWQADPLYHEFYRYASPHHHHFEGWPFPPTRFLGLMSPEVHYGPWQQVAGDRRRQVLTVRTPRRTLTAVHEEIRNVPTTWTVKYLVESREDLAALAEVTWSLDPAHVESALAQQQQALARIGDRGVPRLFVSSPMVCISGAMPLELFLELSYTDSAWLAELCEIMTARIQRVLEALWAGGPLDTVVTFGGSEQCTPPMMAPAMFDRYVVPYEGHLVQWLKARGVPVCIHCHGKVRHALTCMMAMGADATDPVEPPPAGDVTYAQARQIVGDRLTLIGNLEQDWLEAVCPADVRRHVREILALGNRRLIMACASGPMGRVTRRTVDNYKAWIDAALEC